MDLKFYEALLESINRPIVFADNLHVIRYVNKAARERYYKKRGDENPIGRSLLDCHNEESGEKIRQIHQRLLNGEDEVFLKINRHQERITVVAVRDAEGGLLGYYERFENATGLIPVVKE